MSSRFSYTLMLSAIAVTLSACAHQPLNRQEAFLAASPRSILVIPVVNKSVDVTAADYMLSTASVPLAERGYYVFPINLVKRVLEDEGLADSSLVHAAPSSKLAGLFGADAVLYITIDRWDAQYAVINTAVTVLVNYEIRDGKSDRSLWKARSHVVQNSDSGGGGGLAGLIAKSITAAIARAAPDYMPLARRANLLAINEYPGHGIPMGPYVKAEEP